MPTPDETRQALILITAQAVQVATRALSASIDELLEVIPAVIGYYADGTAALAADHYDDLREAAEPRGRYIAEPIIEPRAEKIRRGSLWAVEPLRSDTPDLVTAQSRVAEVVQLESARPFRSTIVVNQDRDPAAVGWRRHTSLTGCKLCRMLASRGAVYRESTARFASHPHCHCTAAPVFDGGSGPEASVMQYLASQRRRSEADRARLRAYLAALPD